MKLSVEARNARAAALAKMLAGGKLCIVSSSGGEIASVELPGTMTVKDGAIAAVSSPVRVLASAAGTPAMWRVEKGGKTVAEDAVGKGFPLPEKEILQGQMIELRSWSIADGDDA